MQDAIELFFPEKSVTARELETSNALKNWALLTCKKILGEDVDEKREQVDQFLLSLYKPMVVYGKKNSEAMIRKGYEKAVGIIVQESSLNPRDMTGLQFLTQLEILEEKAKEIKKRNRPKNGNTR